MNQEQLLDELQTERNKFTQVDTDKMLALIEQIDYPTPYRYTVLEMVEGYGSRWHIYLEPLNCPHCNVDLCDRETGVPFKRELAFYDMEQDRATHFICPDCNGIIERL